jgi:hypothetical protein
MKLLYFIIVINWCPQSFAQAQENSFHLIGNQQEGEIYLSWRLDKGYSCAGTDIERSFDTTHFERIGRIFGICGSFDFDQAYSFTDISPIPNSINYYRLVLGNRDYSSILPVYFVAFNNFGYAVDNTATSTTIYFLKNSIDHLKLMLFDFNGRLLNQFADITDNKVEFENNNLHHGFYVFILTDENGNKLQRGKIFID